MIQKLSDLVLRAQKLEYAWANLSCDTFGVRSETLSSEKHVGQSWNAMLEIQEMWD